MAPPFLTILTGRNPPKIRQAREPAPPTINEKTIADFTRVVEQTGILERERLSVRPKIDAKPSPAAAFARRRRKEWKDGFSDSLQ